MYQTEYERWLASDALTKEEKAELTAIAHDEEAKALRFTAPMDFGTAGLRSTMNMGIGSMNRFAVAQTTRGIAALIREAHGEERGAAIAYDSRNHSEEFAKMPAAASTHADARQNLTAVPKAFFTCKRQIKSENTQMISGTIAGK